MPLLFLEVDNGADTRAEIADKLDRYAGFFARTEKSRPEARRERPLWRTVWTAPDGQQYGRVIARVGLVVTGRASSRTRAALILRSAR
ncbi:hypothetical protein ABZ891_26605 [Streptomyces sp. NPDC047023]|uniref:hypothetical protein n=1 Tax=Streptomyces sp. NPDC047023 TaxID=3155139 RepID=UPI0033DCAABF